MMNWNRFIREQLAKRRENAAWRQRRVIDCSTGRFIQLNGQSYLNFSGNDYLGLSQHPEVIAAWKRGADQYGVGSGGSGHVTGYTHAHHQLEQSLAEWLGYPKALLFISGFAANQAVISALMAKNDTILTDKFSHASIIEASMLSNANLRRFKHNNLASLEQLLNKPTIGKTLVVTEGVFSMDGDEAPLSTIQSLTRQHAAWLMVDDAHGIGVKGYQGRGSCDANGIKPEILIVTFGKAFGMSGAAVLCDNDSADYFIQCARHLIYSTSMPPAQAIALQETVRQIKQADEQRERLNANIQLFRQRFAELMGSNNASLSAEQMLTLGPSLTAIQPVIVGSNQRSLQLACYLAEQNIWAQAIRPPTVPPGSARLRITLSASHCPDDIEKLVEVIGNYSIGNCGIENYGIKSYGIKNYGIDNYGVK